VKESSGKLVGVDEADEMGREGREEGRGEGRKAS